MPIEQVSDDSSPLAEIVSAELLSNGKVLLVGMGPCYLWEPDQFGSYENGTIRRIADIPRTTQYTPAIRLNNGNLVFLPGEYGTAWADGRWTMEFDIRTEQWINVVQRGIQQNDQNFAALRPGPRPFFGAHTPIATFGNGQIIGISSRINRDQQFDPVNFVGSQISNNPVEFNGTNQTVATWYQEMSLALWPGGFIGGASSEILCMVITYTPEGSDTYTPRYREYRRGESAPGPLFTLDLSSTNAGFWRCDGMNTISTQGNVAYEQGAHLFVPKINRMVIFASNGGIYSNIPNVSSTTPPSFTRLASMPVAPDIPLVNDALGIMGGVKADQDGMTLAQIVARGYFEFTVDNSHGTTDGSHLMSTQLVRLQQQVDIWGADLPRFIVGLNNSETVARLKFSSYQQMDATTIRLTGLSGDGFPLGQAMDWRPGRQLVAGDRVCLDRPALDCRDAHAAILPNGDVVFFAGVGRFRGDARGAEDFNVVSMLLKWVPGQDSIAQFVDPTAVFAAEFLCTMLVLPTGQIGFTSFNRVFSYLPTQAELTPDPAWRPVIQQSPTVIPIGGMFSISGYRLNGPHVGASFGDDKGGQTNFPIVRLRSLADSRVYYCTTSNWTYRGINVDQQASQGSFNVEVPGNLPPGDYALELLASGIPATTTPVVRAYDVTAAEGVVVDRIP